MIVKKEWTKWSTKRSRRRDPAFRDYKGWFLFGILPIYITMSNWYR